jgi:predicted acylesterase/phospholipase RssA
MLSSAVINISNNQHDHNHLYLGGGLKGYFVCGCVAVLQQQLQNHNIEIARVAGASAGAWSALFICTGITTSIWIESYHKLLENPDKTIHEIYVEEMVFNCATPSIPFTSSLYSIVAPCESTSPR